MQRTLNALLLASALFVASPAWADTVYNVSKVIITGNKSVTTDKLMAVVQEHPGSKVTVADIQADLAAITKVLEDSHVAGSVNVSVRTEGALSEIIFAVNDQGTYTPQVTTVAPKLDAEIFDGNASIPTATLATATGLKPGDDLSNAKILAAEQAIIAAYKGAKLPVGMAISGENKQLANGTVDVYWHIVETKAAKKPKDTSDQGAVSE